MSSIKKNDEVIILKGKDRGKRGKVLKIITKTSRALVEGANLIKKHLKPNTRLNTPGGIVTKEGSIHLANIALYNPLTKKADRIGFKTLEDGRKVRYFKSNNELVDI